MPKMSRNCSKLMVFFSIKKLISLIVRRRTKRGSTVICITSIWNSLHFAILRRTCVEIISTIKNWNMSIILPSNFIFHTGHWRFSEFDMPECFPSYSVENFCHQGWRYGMKTCNLTFEILFIMNVAYCFPGKII